MEAERRALRMLRIAGTAVLVLFAVLTAVGPSAPVRENTPGFTNPVAAFELASRPEHVFGIIGRPGSAERGTVAFRVRAATWIDFLFLLSYPFVYVGIALLLEAHGLAPRWLVGTLLGLAAVMALGDALENREMLALMRGVDPVAMEPGLARLRVFTLAKWHALFGASALVAAAVWREQGWWRWSAVPFALAALVGFGSLVHLPAIEWSMAPMGVAWTMTYARSFRRQSA